MLNISCSKIKTLKVIFDPPAAIKGLKRSGYGQLKESRDPGISRDPAGAWSLHVNTAKVADLPCGKKDGKVQYCVAK